MTGPLVAIVITVILLFGMIATRGPVFSFEPLKPKFEHVNPAKGLQRIASMRNVVEFVKGLAKAVLLAAVFVAILVAWLQSLFEVPGCGQSCVLPMTLAILTPMGIAAALAFMVVGLIDVPIQRWLFLRDMRMTRTEYKREHKDLEGDPLIRQALQRQRRAAVTQPAKLGLNNAVLVLVSGDRLIALRYKSGETPVPIVVSKGQGQVGTALLSRARNLDLPIVQDGALVDDLFPNSRLGEYVEAEHFSAIIRYLVQLGLV
jgi:type III secretion protein U